MVVDCRHAVFGYAGQSSYKIFNWRPRLLLRGRISLDFSQFSARSDAQ